MEKKKLLAALSFVKPGISRKSTSESMLHFYFSGTHVVSYNNMISISYPLKTDFKAFIKADHLYEVISKLKKETLEFVLEDDVLTMTSGKVRTSFSTIQDEDAVKRIETIKRTKDAAKKLPSDFVEGISLCAHAASTIESDDTLTCVSIKGKSMVATDNIKIAHYVLSEPMDDMLLKASEMKNLIQINPEFYEVTNSWIHFISKEGCVFSILQTKGGYPDMIKFMQFDGIPITLNKSLVEGIDLSSVFTSKDDPSINIAIKGGWCRIFKKSDGGKIDFREKIEYTGKDISFNIHHELLREMMNYSTNITLSEGMTKLTTGNFTFVTALYNG